MIDDGPGTSPVDDDDLDAYEDDAEDLDEELASLGDDAVLEDRYEVREVVGRGGMGWVYRAFDRKLGEDVALKVLFPRLAAEARVLERFKQEARLSRRISHPNVVRVHDLGQSGEVVYLSMELLSGESIRSILKNLEDIGPIGLNDGLWIAREVTAGLKAAHDLGVVHLDVKPQNLFVLSDGSVKILDFGVATAVSLASGSQVEAMGTPAYMAPERFDPDRPIDHRADLYSVGVVMYELFTGERPFTGEDHLEVAVKQMRAKPIPPRRIEPSIPAELERIILKLLEKDPERRFPSADELLDALDELLGRRDERPAARPASGLVDRPGLIGGAIAAALVVLVMAAAGVRTFRARAVEVAPGLPLAATPSGTTAAGDAEGAGGTDGGVAGEPVDAAGTPSPGDETAVQAAAAARDEPPTALAAPVELPPFLTLDLEVPEEPADRSGAAEPEVLGAAEIADIETGPAARPADRVQRLLEQADALYRRRHLLLPSHENAFMLYTEVLALDPKNATARARLEQMKRFYVSGATRRYRSGELEAALVYLKRARRVDPGDRAVREMVGSLEAELEALRNPPPAPEPVVEATPPPPPPPPPPAPTEDEDEGGFFDFLF